MAPVGRPLGTSRKRLDTDSADFRFAKAKEASAARRPRLLIIVRSGRLLGSSADARFSPKGSGPG